MADKSGDIHSQRRRQPKPHQLPGTTKSLVNQKRALAALDESRDKLQHQPGPSTTFLLGPSGIGKVTVALHWLHGSAHWFQDGQLYANLGAWTSQATAPYEILGEFLVSLGYDRGDLPTDLESRASAYRSLTEGLSLQILLRGAVTEAQVRALMPGRGNSVVVVTGNGKFGTFRQDNAQLIDILPLEQPKALELLRQFASDRLDDDPEATDQILAVCGGWPFALRVVGRMLAEMPALPVAELLEDLTDPEILLADVDPALAGVFEAGYHRLSELAKRCYRAIGLHPDVGDIPVGSLAAALGLSERQLRRQAIHELVALKIVDQPEHGRLVVHNLVRRHAREVARTFDSADECRATQNAILEWYRNGVVAADSELMKQRPWRRLFFPDLAVQDPPADPRQWLEGERANLRAAVAMAFELGAHDIVFQMCVALWSLYEHGKYFDDLIATHELALKVPGEELVKVLLRIQLGFAYSFTGQPAKALEVSVAAASDIQHDAGNIQWEVGIRTGLAASAIEGAGLAAFALKHDDQALELLRRNLELAEQIADPRRIGLASLHLAKVETTERAAELLRQALVGFRSLPEPDRVNEAKTLLWLGKRLGASDHLEAALAIMTELNRHFDCGQILDAVGELAFERGEHQEARSFYERALEIYRDHGYYRSAVETSVRLENLTPPDSTRTSDGN